jgi:competence protein ComEA
VGIPTDRGEPARVAARVRAVLGHEPGPLERLTARRPLRVDPGRRGLVSIGAVAALAAVLTGWWVWSSRPEAVDLGRPAAAVPSSFGSTAVGSPAPRVVVVDVVGKVRRPGVYRLPESARVGDAVAAAGGARPGVDLTSVNLAARLVDGQQIAVGLTTGAGAPAPAAPAGAAGGPVPALVNLNAATLEQLETLPGVGPVLAQHILDWRTQHGSFGSVDQLNDVPGIGEVKFTALRDLVTV